MYRIFVGPVNINSLLYIILRHDSFVNIQLHLSVDHNGQLDIIVHNLAVPLGLCAKADYLGNLLSVVQGPQRPSTEVNMWTSALFTFVVSVSTLMVQWWRHFLLVLHYIT